MKVFGQIVRTVVNVGGLPMAILKDVLTLGGRMVDPLETKSYTTKKIEQIKLESQEDI